MKRFAIACAITSMFCALMASATSATATAAVRPVASVSVQKVHVEATLDVASATRHRHHSIPLRIRALKQARAKRGDWYVYGSAGPNTFDCSGLVMWAYHHAGKRGRRLARDTTEMLGQVGTVLKRVWHPKKGDLAFFGSDHVELWLGKIGGWGHHHWFVYGAEETGTQVHADEIFPGTSWWPTAFYQVV